MKVEKSPIAEYLFKYKYTIKTVKLIKTVNNYKELNIKAAIAVFKNENK